jgi:hypothetical protein
VSIRKKDFEYLVESYFNLDDKKRMRNDTERGLGWIGIDIV